MTHRRNPNLDRHMTSVHTALRAAEATGRHVHAHVRVDNCGGLQGGPLLGFAYDFEDQDDYGWIEVVNYLGETLRKPMTAVNLYEIRPCWDNCQYAPGAAPQAARPSL